jgi:hypothetical protein
MWWLVITFQMVALRPALSTVKKCFPITKKTVYTTMTKALAARSTSGEGLQSGNFYFKIYEGSHTQTQSLARRVVPRLTAAGRAPHLRLHERIACRLAGDMALEM